MQALLERNRNRVLADIERACSEAGRSPGDVQLVAVTKSVSAEVAAALFELGQADLGESRLEELERKRADFAARGLEPRWHFVGHVQRNKAGRIVRAVDEIHSVDSLALLETIDRHAREAGRRPAVYFQVMLSNEETKHGFDPANLVTAVDRAAELDHVELVGLMTMAPLCDDEHARLAAARDVFVELAALAAELPALAFSGGRPRLSMGMSGDFALAVAAGAHVVRVGTGLFQGIADR